MNNGNYANNNYYYPPQGYYPPPNSPGGPPSLYDQHSMPMPSHNNDTTSKFKMYGMIVVGGCFVVCGVTAFYMFSDRSNGAAAGAGGVRKSNQQNESGDMGSGIHSLDGITGAGNHISGNPAHTSPQNSAHSDSDDGTPSDNLNGPQPQTPSQPEASASSTELKQIQAKVDALLDVTTEEDLTANLESLKSLWNKVATAGEASASNPVEQEMKHLIEEGKKSFDVVVHDIAREKLTKTIMNKASTLEGIQKTFDSYLMLNQKLNVITLKPATTGDSKNACELCEVQLFEMSRKAAKGEAVDPEQAIKLLCAPGEFLSLTLSARLALVDILKADGSDTKAVLGCLSNGDQRKLNERVKDDLFRKKTDIVFPGRNTVQKAFNFSNLLSPPTYSAKVRLEELQSFLKSIKSGNTKLLSDFSEALGNFSSIMSLPPLGYLEKVCKELGTNLEAQLAFLERYADFVVILLAEGECKNLDKEIKRRVIHACNLRNAAKRTIGMPIRDRNIIEAEEWKGFVEDPKDPKKFVKLVKKLDAFNLTTNAVKEVVEEALEEAKFQHDASFYREVEKRQGLEMVYAFCNLYSLKVDDCDEEAFKKLRSKDFDMKEKESRDALSSLFINYLDEFTTAGTDNFPKQIEKLLSAANADQKNTVFALMHIANLQWLVLRHPIDLVAFKKVSRILKSMIDDINTSNAEIQEATKTLIFDRSDKQAVELFYSVFKMAISNMNPQSFVALDFVVAYHYWNLKLALEEKLKGDNAHLMAKFLPKSAIDTQNIALLIKELKKKPELNAHAVLWSFGDAYFKAASAQRAFLARKFSVPLSSAVFPISMDAAIIFKLYAKFVVYLTYEPFKKEASNPDVQKEKERVEGLMAKITDPSVTLTNASQLLEEYVDKRFEEKYTAIEGELNEWYKIPASASTMPLDESLNLQNLTNAIGTKWEDFEAFILHSSIKRTQNKMKDAAFREEFFKDFLDNNCQDLNLESLERDFATFQQMLRIKKKSEMNADDSKLYEWKYKPLENMPDELASAIDADLVGAEEALKRRLLNSVPEIERFFILSPYTKKGSIFETIYH